MHCLQAKEVQNPDFNLLGLTCTGDASGKLQPCCGVMPDNDLPSICCCCQHACDAALAGGAESGLIKCVELLRSVEEYHKANPKIHEIKFNSTNKWQVRNFTGSKWGYWAELECGRV